MPPKIQRGIFREKISFFRELHRRSFAEGFKPRRMVTEYITPCKDLLINPHMPSYTKETHAQNKKREVSLAASIPRENGKAASSNYFPRILKEGPISKGLQGINLFHMGVDQYSRKGPPNNHGQLSQFSGTYHLFGGHPM